MKAPIFFVSCWILFALASGALSAETQASDQIHSIAQLTVEQLEQFFKATEKTQVVHFYNASCTDYCSELLQTLKANAAAFKKLDSSLTIHSVDYSALQQFQEYIHIDNGAAIIAFYRGETLRLDLEPAENVPARNLQEDISLFLSKEVRLLESAEAAKTAFAEHKFVHIYFGNTSLEFFPNIEVAAKSTNAHIFRTESKELAASLGIKTRNYLYTYEPAANASLRMKSYPLLHKVERFLNASVEPVPRQYTPEELSLSLAQGFPVIVARATNAKASKKLFEKLATASDQVRNYFHVYDVTDQSAELLKSFDEECNLPKSTRTTYICIFRQRDEQVSRYIYGKEELTVIGIAEMIAKYTSGTLKPYILSEKLTEKDKTGSVRSLNTNSLAEYFSQKNETDHAVRLLYFYKNDCLDCEKFIKLMETFAETANREELLFAKINVDRNEISSPQEIPGLLAYQVYEDVEADKLEGDWNHDSLKALVDKALDRRKQLLEEVAAQKLDL